MKTNKNVFLMFLLRSCFSPSQLYLFTVILILEAIVTRICFLVSIVPTLLSVYRRVFMHFACLFLYTATLLKLLSRSQNSVVEYIGSFK